VAQKETAEAIKLLENAKQMHKDDRDISVMLIDLYGKDKQWEKAENIAKALLENSETKELPHYKLAQLYMGQQKFEEAIVQFRHVLVTKPTASDVLAGMVNSYLALKQDKKAEELLDNILAENKDNPALLTMRAELYRNNKQFSDAERMFKRIIELKPNVELGYKNLATVYLVQKQLANALNVYQQGLLAIPESSVFYMQLAIINTIKDDTINAIGAYENLLLKTPDNLLAVNNLAALLVESSDQKQVEKALTIIAPLKDSEYTAFLDTYGWVNFKNGKTDEALIALESVISKEDVIPEMHYHLGMVYIEKGRVEEAKLELEKAVAEDAKYKALETAKAELEKLKTM
ncbi:MAG: tetratricopeptide repeat protein, partial [Methylococcales bacterium]|nr:tetratricopeptide repeat protein [Methylococcales bacterium]